LIPDPIPILGYLDDLILIPLGIAIALKMMPSLVLAECREQAEKTMSQNKPKPTNYVAAAVIVLIWVLVAALAIVVLARVIRG
jgi:uncharacterized membrane protein YkvA (DUF1232 family)